MILLSLQARGVIHLATNVSDNPLKAIVLMLFFIITMKA